MLEQHIWPSRTCALQVDKGANTRSPLARVHEAMRSCQDGLLATIQQQHEGSCQLDLWAHHYDTRHLQSRPHTGSAV